MKFRRLLAGVGESARVEEFEGERRYLTFPAHGFAIVLDEGRVVSFINESKFAYELAQARVHVLHARSNPAVSSRPATFHARPIFISVIKLIHKILLTNTGAMSTIKVPGTSVPGMGRADIA